MKKKEASLLVAQLIEAGTEVYETIIAIEAQKGENSLWSKEFFRHDFKGSSAASVYGLPDGSLLIKSKAGKRLWKNCKY